MLLATGCLDYERKYELFTRNGFCEERFNYAWMLRNVYRDKADMSFTDLTSFVLMKELNISRAFTGDHHFEMTNLGFDIWPKEP